MYVRYELQADGEPQGIGFLQGMDDAGIPEHVQDELIRPFDEHMPLPPGDILQANICQSWFTEAGDKFFSDAIAAVVSAYEDQDGIFEVVRIEVDELDHIVYADEYQALVLVEWDWS